MLAIVLFIFAIWSDKIKVRSPFIMAGLIMCCIGFAINISDVSIGVKYFGTFFCVAGSYAAFPGVVAWYVHCGIAVTIREKDVMMTPSIQPGLEIISQANTNAVWE